MARRELNRLTDIQVRTLKEAKRHSDGGGLWLEIRPSGSRSWLFLQTKDGKQKWKGLGPYPAISLAQAREKAAVLRGGGSLNTTEVPTFREAAKQFMIKEEANFKTPLLSENWGVDLWRYATPLESIKVDAITQDHVMAMLTPIWDTVPASAQAVRNKVERILSFCTAKRWRSGDNPADWKVLKYLLSKPKKLTHGHRAALPYEDVPAFVATLRASRKLTATALEFVILSACRVTEALHLRVSEIDRDNATFTVPAIRMKGGKPHVVPLTPRMLEILEKMASYRINDFVFPGVKLGRPLTLQSLHYHLKDIKPATLHGFRSSFRDWSGDETSHPREICEAALAHVVGGVEGAYRRASALRKRRQLMCDWAAFVGSATGERAAYSAVDEEALPTAQAAE